ncbi:hypothetical protein [Pedobacter nutrimenti]|jgi:hypothetical protein|uniref:Uncharacterized protein n=1 Tax=Pedobacter nutrimenti TaxID=1241337 RepID=A0A318UNH9_9SPHI|nr:hypothetical protein [Pedobacter nutrimenti]PYF76648.1 hypothetical protein B0O44_101119 [Pedobacter nutrimenti]
MEKHSKADRKLIKMVCTSVPYNGILSNFSELLNGTDLDHLSVRWPKRQERLAEKKELAYDLNFYLSISG